MRKLISIIASVCMVLTMVPAAFAAQDQPAFDGQDQPAFAEDATSFADMAAFLPLADEPGAMTEEPVDDPVPVVKEGWQQDAPGIWLFYQNGTPLTGFQSFGASWYYFNETGELQWGLCNIDGYKYYFDETALTPGATPGDPGQRLGVMHTGWLRDYWKNQATYYFMENGRAKTNGFLWEGKFRYFFKKSGKMKTGWMKRNGKKFYFRTSGANKGAAVTGLHAVDGDRYYFNDNGVMKTGVIEYEGALYYFNKDGKAQKGKGWFTGSDNKKRYCLGKGKIASGTVKIGGIWYLFDSSTGVYQKSIGDDTDKAVQKYSSNTSKLIFVKRADHFVRVYTGSKNNWKHYSTMSCSVGAKSTPTPKGSFTIGGREEIEMNSKQTVNWWYNTHFYGKYQFQSVLYYTDPETHKPAHDKVYDGRLGADISDGCIRLSLTNAEWIYRNVPAETKVVIK